MKYVLLGVFIVMGTIVGTLAIEGKSPRAICYGAGALVGGAGVIMGQSLLKNKEP